MQKKKKEKSCLQQLRGGKTQLINIHYWLYRVFFAATPIAATGFGSERK